MYENEQTTQEKRRSNRKSFRNGIKYHLKVNNIKQKDLAREMGLTDQEFHNFLTGYQSSAPAKGIDTFEDFKKKVLEHIKTEDI